MSSKEKEVKLSPAQQLKLVSKRIATKKLEITEARAILNGYRKRKELLEFRAWKKTSQG